MGTIRRLRSESLQALLQEASEKYSDWFVIGKVPEETDGPPYVLLIRTAITESEGN